MTRLLPLLALLFTTIALADDETDFTTAPPASWQRVNPLNRAAFDFSGGTARLTCTAPSLPEAQFFGPARATLLAPTVYGQTAVSADLVAWVPTTDRLVDGTFMGLLSRVQAAAGLGQTSGYSLSVIDRANGNAQLQLYRLDNENPTRLVDPIDFPFSADHTYRLVLVSAGAVHTGLIFDLADLTYPLATVTATDATYAAGRTGLVISTDRLIPLDVTFDKFLAWDGTPPPLSIAPGQFYGTVRLSWDALRGLACRLEQSSTLTAWREAFPFLGTQIGPTLQSHVTTAGPKNFYRLHLFGD